MTLTPVTTSKAIRAHGYDERTRTLHIEFRTGHRYAYSEFPAEAYQAFQNAPSAGSHFAREILPHYDGVKQ